MHSSEIPSLPLRWNKFSLASSFILQVVFSTKQGRLCFACYVWYPHSQSNKNMLKYWTSKEIFTSDRIVKGMWLLKTGLVYVVVNFQRSKGTEAYNQLGAEGEKSTELAPPTAKKNLANSGCLQVLVYSVC